MDTNIVQSAMGTAITVSDDTPSTQSVPTYSVTVKCTSPLDGAAIVSRVISLPVVFTGTTVAHDSSRIANIRPDEVSVRFGANTPQLGIIANQPDSHGEYPWSFSGNMPPSANPVLVTVAAKWEYDDGKFATDGKTLTLNPDTTPPSLTVSPLPNPLPVSVPIGSLADIPISGGTSDAGGTGLDTVQLKLDNGAFTQVTPVAPDWSSWSAHVRPQIGSNIINGEQHALTFEAIDKSGNRLSWTQPSPLTFTLVDSPPQLGLTKVNSETPIFTPTPPAYQVRITTTEQGATILVKGNASTVNEAVPGRGVGVGISRVTWSVEGGASGTATLEGTGDARSYTWTVPAIVIPYDPFREKRTVTFACQNTNGTWTTVVLTVTLELSFSSPDPETLSSLSYLYDLLHFAREIPRITVSGQLSSNIAPSASVTVSSTYSAAYSAQKAIDGITDGTSEWASLGEQNPWIQLTWATPRTISSVRLYDRVNLSDNANGGTLTFSDGSSLAVSGIPNNGTMLEITFPAKTVTWVKFKVTSGTGPNVGLSEFQVIALPMAAPTAGDLSSEFHQPFDDLAVLSNKDVGTDQVRQIRLCVEVLRAYLAPAVTTAPDYLSAAYNTLLNQIGTSFEEIRQVRSFLSVPPQTEPAIQRRDLADRLGVDLGTAQPDPLAQLLLDPDAPPSQLNAVTEQILERLFGLRDTTRDVLSDCAKLGDAQSQITRWNLQGVEWGRNTDLNGFIYVSLTKLSAAAYQVTLYRDAARIKPVAFGQSASAAGAVILQPQNNSGLSGNLVINYAADSTAISFAAVPTFLSWQLAHLRTLWKGEDYPDTPPADMPPIIDPDLLVPGDFKSRVSTDPAYQLYTTRANTLQGWFNTLKTTREQAASPQAGLNTILQTVLGKSSTDLVALDQARQAGTDTSSDLATLGLTADAFGYLVRICTLVNTNPPSPLLNGEWNEVYSILVQVQKQQAFNGWRTEEYDANLTLGPDYFELLSADATPVPVFYSTGLAADGTPLSDGDVDPHWMITATPAGPTTASAYVTKNSNPVGITWLPNSDTSRWISPQTNELNGDAIGSYTYRTTFDLTGFDPATVRLTAKVAVDDAVDKIKLNGQILSLSAAGPAAFHTLSISSGFTVNVNTLEFSLKNNGTTTNSSGLRVELTVSATPYTEQARPWRASEQARFAWQSMLQARLARQEALVQAQRAAVDITEQLALPLLRDALLNAAPASPDQLTQMLLIDVQGSSYQMTTRLGQAIETLQNLFVALLERTPRTFTSPRVWVLADLATVSEWQWMGSYASWQAAMRVFLWPENLLLPSLRRVAQPPAQWGDSTQAFNEMVKRVRGYPRLTPDQARAEAAHWLHDMGSQNGLPQTLTEQLDEAGLVALQTLSRNVLSEYTDKQTPPHYTSVPPIYLQEAYYFVPMQLALQLQQSGQFEAALAWFRTVYDYELRATQEWRVYYGLVVEGSTATKYMRLPHWLTTGLDAHRIAAETRANAYTCYTLMSIVRCMLDYADAEFTGDSAEAVARARTLYLSARNLYAVLEGLLPSVPGIEANPLPPILDQHAALNLSKMRRGENIAGMLRQIRTFQDSKLEVAQRVSVQPTPYRYTVLIERAKHLVNLAQQIEGSYLAALEKTDAEAYNIFKARQDLSVAQSTVELQNRRVIEAEDGVTLADGQKQKSQMQVNTYKQRLAAGLMNDYEKRQLTLMGDAARLQYTSAAFSAIAGVINFEGGAAPGLSGIATALSSWASGLSTEASILGTIGSYERRAADWQFQLDLANKDALIGAQQVEAAQHHQSVVEQESAISQLQADHVQATVDFLANKFTNVELYEWMSGVLGRVYAYFLQQATAMARLAQSQLAFERQEKSLSVIQSDYWGTSSETAAGSGTGNQAPDRRGLTGSARLLQDIYQLDQYAFETNRRKLQLTKTISLAGLAPSEFQSFRETGVLPFATPMRLFDQDFPGHLLRLVRRVRVSIIALIPPTQGIRATLSTTGFSRVVVSDGAGGFQNVVVRHDPEAIALSSPLNATGLFELDPQPELMAPFEGMGVDTSWEFQLPTAANRFDYGTIADVLVTIDYTALNSFDYRQLVIRDLNRHISAERPFSFRNRFADQWYELHNPDQKIVSDQMAVRFTTERNDFPPNIENLAIAQLVLYIARKDGQLFSVPLNATLDFTPKGTTEPIGGTVGSLTGIYSTRSGNSASWIPIIGATNNPNKPFGEWTLTLTNDQRTRDYFKNEEIEDILFVITYSGQTPPWPV